MKSAKNLAGPAALAVAAFFALVVGLSATQLSAPTAPVRAVAASPMGCVDYLCTFDTDCYGTGFGCNSCASDGRCGIIR